MSKFGNAAFIPAFEIGQRVRVNPDVGVDGGRVGAVVEHLKADGYLLQLDDGGIVGFERRELTAEKA